MSEIKEEAINLNVVERPPTYAEVVSGREAKPITIQPISSNRDFSEESDTDESESKEEPNKRKGCRRRCEDCLVDCGTIVCIDCCINCFIIGCVGTCTQSLCKGCDLGA